MSKTFLLKRRLNARVKTMPEEEEEEEEEETEEED